MIYTSYFAKASREPNAVCVAGGGPPFWEGPVLKELALTREVVKQYKQGQVTEEQYTEAYNKKLEELDAAGYDWDALDDKILLCWEATGKFCHRHLLAEFLRSKGFEVQELE